ATAKIDAEMKTGSVTLLIKVTPPPQMWIDGKPWKGARDKIEGISAGEEHKLLIAANGYTPKTIAFTAEQGETKTIEEHLVRLDPAAVAAAAREEREKKSEEKGGGGPATVRVGSHGGFCNVTINGTSYGPTPVQATVNSGTVRVSCKPPSGASMSQAVSVGPGETARVSFKVSN
ncbi:MAG TPA: PEGA domain-containing protein, partial [Minicystis sp.]|nr:PEGA domain-containing protein [Minicystis sp.]